MENTKIEWADHSFNIAWGCMKVSAGCLSCYAQAWDQRWGGKHWGPNSKRKTFDEKHWREPLKWNNRAEKEGKKYRVFCSSMADVFEDHPDMVEPREQLWNTIYATPNLIWMLLTKRPENIMKMLPFQWVEDGIPENIWIGTSVEDQENAEKRIPHLLKVPAKVRFLSMEPLLEKVDLWGARYKLPDIGMGSAFAWGEGVNWVIVGGESGQRARPIEADWVRSLRDQCEAAKVPFFFKQWGGINKKEAGHELDGQVWQQLPKYE